MGKSKRFRSLFGRKDTTGSTDQPQPPLQPESPSATFYRSISNLPLFKYRDCTVNGNLSALIISGFPPESELRSAWLDIQQEYADVIGDNEQRNYLNALNLDNAERRSKGVMLSLQVAMANEEALRPAAGNQKPDEAYFQNMLINLSDAAGYYITDTITVLEFAQRIKRLNDGRGKNR
jgi:hypothetical protein